MIDIKLERLVRLADVPRLKVLPRRPHGRRLHIATVYRWIRRGVRGVRLEAICAGGNTCTSLEAIQRFFDQLTRELAPPLPVPPASRRRLIEEANRQVDAILETGNE